MVCRLCKKRFKKIDLEKYKKERPYKTPVRHAAKHGHVKCIKYLIEHGLDVNETNGAVNFPLHLAAKNGDLECIKCLLNHGADLNAIDYLYNTSLHITAKEGHLDCLRYLIEQGADVNSQCIKIYDHNSDTIYITTNEKCIDFIKSLFTHKSSVYIHIIPTPLHLAADNKHLDCIKYLVEHGVNLDARDDDDYTSLHKAIYRKNLDCIKCLVEHGANIHIQTKHKETPLYIAASIGNLDCIKYLIEQGADTTIKDEYERSPLQCVVERGYLDCAKYLADREIKILPKEEIKLVLYTALSNSKYKCVKIILDCIIKPQLYHMLYVNKFIKIQTDIIRYEIIPKYEKILLEDISDKYTINYKRLETIYYGNFSKCDVGDTNKYYVKRPFVLISGGSPHRTFTRNHIYVSMSNTKLLPVYTFSDIPIR